jgi:hypothetical protein
MISIHRFPSFGPFDPLGHTSRHCLSRAHAKSSRECQYIFSSEKARQRLHVPCFFSPFKVHNLASMFGSGLFCQVYTQKSRSRVRQNCPIRLGWLLARWSSLYLEIAIQVANVSSVFLVVNELFNVALFLLSGHKASILCSMTDCSSQTAFPCHY